MGEPDVIELEFVADRDALAEAQRAVNRLFKLSTGRPLLDFAIEVTIGVAIGVVTALITYGVTKVSGYTSKLPIVAVWFSLTLLCVYYFRKFMAGWYRRRIYNLKEFNEQMHVVIDAQGLTIEMQAVDTRIRWAGVQKLVPLKSGLGLLCGATMFAIPTHAIPTDLGVQGLIARISEWKDAAQ